MDLDKELDNLRENPEKELSKMKSSGDNEKGDAPRPEPPNIEGPNIGDAPNIADAPNVGKNQDSKPEGAANTPAKNAGGNKQNSSSEHEEVYKSLDLVLSTVIDKLKLVFLMPYEFFQYYVKDFLSENKSNEYFSRDIRPAVVSFVLVVLLEFGLSFITKDFSMFKLVPIACCLAYCMFDSDRTKK